MVTIWNKLIQGLVFSGEVSSVKLAFLLVDKPRTFYYWWAAQLLTPSRYGMKNINLPIMDFNEKQNESFGVIMHKCAEKTGGYEGSVTCYHYLENEFLSLNAK